MLFKNTKHGLYPEHLIKFNDEYNTTTMDNDIETIQNMAKELHGTNLFELINDSTEVMKKVTTDNEGVEDNN